MSCSNCTRCQRFVSKVTGIIRDWRASGSTADFIVIPSRHRNICTTPHEQLGGMWSNLIAKNVHRLDTVKAWMSRGRCQHACAHCCTNPVCSSFGRKPKNRKRVNNTPATSYRALTVSWTTEGAMLGSSYTALSRKSEVRGSPTARSLHSCK